MYSLALTVHSYLRYPVLLLLAIVLVREVAALVRASAWDRADTSLGRWTIRAWDVQFLLGLVLYFLSPITQFGLANFGDAMGDAQLRRFTVEHPALLLLATAVLHVGWLRLRRARSDRGKHVRWLIFSVAAVALVVLAIPWQGRPLFRTVVEAPQIF